MRVCIALAIALALAGPAAAQESLLFVGNENGVWAVRNTPSKTFDVAVRTKGGEWQTLSLERAGQAVAAAAVADQLHVLLRDPNAPHSATLWYMIFRADGSEPSLGLNSDDPHWPKGLAVAATIEANQLGPDKGPSLVAIVARPGGPLPAPSTQPAPEPASQASSTTAPAARGSSFSLARRDLFATAPAEAPATAPAEAMSAPSIAPATGESPAGAPPLDLASGIFSLAFFQNATGQWQYFTEINDVPMTPTRRVLSASLDGTLYVLLTADTGLPARLLSYRDNEWQELAAPEELQAARVLNVLAVHDRLVFVQAVAEAADRTTGQLLILDPARNTRNAQRILNGAQPAVWGSNASLPQAARLGDQIALLWKDAEQMHMGTCDLTGQLTETPVEVFRKEVGNGQGTDIIERFLTIVLLAIIVLTFILRPQGPAKPFELPQTMHPASPLKRLGAMVVDVAPLAAASAWAFGITPAELMDALDISADYHMSENFASGMIVLLGAYVFYCTMMEWRLGATAGKLIFHLRVVGEEGRPPRLGQVALRNILKIVEVLWPPRVPVLLLLPLFTRHRQRLGDLFAKTTVIHWPPLSAADSNKP